MTDTTIFTRPKGTHHIAQALCGAAFLAAVFFLLLKLEGQAHLPAFLLLGAQGLPMVLLAFAGLFWRHDFSGVCAFFALLASATGDLFFALSDPGSVMMALRSFALTHGLFIFIFLLNRAPARDVGLAQTRLATLLWAGAIVFAFLVWPELDQRDPTMLAYGLMMAVMATTALLSSLPSRLVGTGSVLFIAAHAVMLADHMSILPSSWTSDWSMALGYSIYLIGQAALIIGIAIGQPRRLFTR